MTDYLLNLAKKAIVNYLEKEEVFSPSPETIPPKYRKKGAVFVTLKRQGKLRGCIGNIISFEPLYKNVIRNAIEAAFNDPRFYPLTNDELNDLEIEISIIQPPQEFFYNSLEELCDYLEKNKPGVILRSQGHQAVYLPTVWQELPSCQQFLSTLCLKADLKDSCWQDPETQIFIFKAKEITSG